MIRDRTVVWQGVYPSFAGAPAEGPGFAGPEWLARSVALARHSIDALSAGAPLDYSLTQRNAMLPHIVGSMLMTQRRVRVLDFGGGPGLGYLALKQALPDMGTVDYVVVDSPAICAAGEGLLTGGPAFRDITPTGESFDIVHAASVLQYIEDWRGAVASLVASRPAFLSLGDIFAGDFAAFVTLQNYYGSRIRHWMFNLDELVAEVGFHGYRLTLRQACRVEILGRRGPLPMDALLPQLRIPHTHHLLFGRTDEKS